MSPSLLFDFLRLKSLKIIAYIYSLIKLYP